MRALELGSISLIGMLDAALALTPSASMLNSSLAHQHRQKSWGVGVGLGVVRGCHFPRISKQSSGKRGGEKKISLIHSVSLQRSEVIAEVKPNETDSSPARRRQAEIKDTAGPCHSDFHKKSTENSFVSKPGCLICLAASNKRQLSADKRTEKMI